MSKTQSDAIRIAKQLCYKADVIERIKSAKSETEISRILHDAREAD
jgi:hypothetical protein